MVIVETDSMQQYTNRYSSSIKNSDQHRYKMKDFSPQNCGEALCFLLVFNWMQIHQKRFASENIFQAIEVHVESSPTFNKPTERKFGIGHYIAMFVLLFCSSFHSRFKLAHSCQKRSNLDTNSLNKLLFQ
jgi:hypothetical protein